MLNTMGNQWVVPSMGLLEIPEKLERHAGDWRIYTNDDTFWSWRDADHGYNHLDSLRAAAPFAVTMGTLDPEQIREYRTLYDKGRLTPTGVLGVFYRAGLKAAYLIVLDGDVVEFPYADGRGFGKAATAAGKLMSEKTKSFLKKIEVTSDFRWP